VSVVADDPLPRSQRCDREETTKTTNKQPRLYLKKKKNKNSQSVEVSVVADDPLPRSQRQLIFAGFAATLAEQQDK